MQLGQIENARVSTHQAHSRSTRPVGKRCARRNVLVRSSSGARGSSLHMYHVVYLQPHTLKPTYFFPPLKNQDKTGHFSGVQSELLIRARSELHPSTRRGHHGKGAMRVRMLKSAAGQELARVTAVGQQSANLGRRQHTSTAVLAATDPNLLNWGSTAVAHTISYSWRPVDEEVGIYGDEHSSGCVLPLAHIAEFWRYCYESRELLPCDRYKHADTHHTCSMVSSTRRWV